MMALPAKNREYIVIALAGTPVILAALLEGLQSTDPAWDLVVEADRFTLREIVAHLADIDPVFVDRIKRTSSEFDPTLKDFDEGQAALDEDYAHSDVEDSFARFQASRAHMIKLLEDLPDQAWTRISHKDGAEWPLYAWAVQVLAHDGYHLRQVSEWVRRAQG